MNADLARIVLVTAPDLSTARHLARLILESKAAACVNIVGSIESHYWWQQKIETAQEHLLVIKTTSDQLHSLESLVTTHHPYDTPEFLALPITDGSQKYLDWIFTSVQSQ